MIGKIIHIDIPINKDDETILIIDEKSYTYTEIKKIIEKSNNYDSLCKQRKELNNGKYN